MLQCLFVLLPSLHPTGQTQTLTSQTNNFLFNKSNFSTTASISQEHENHVAPVWKAENENVALAAGLSDTLGGNNASNCYT